MNVFQFLISLLFLGFVAARPELGILHKKSKVINGNAVWPPHAYPWMASIRIRGEGDSVSTHTCGGSLVSDRFVLTAAHCIRSNEQMAAILGIYNIDSYSPDEVYFAEQVFVHEGFIDNGDGQMINDIALLKLSRPVPLTQDTQVINIPSVDTEIFGTPLFTAGWGSITRSYGNIQLSDTLQQTILTASDSAAICGAVASWQAVSQICASSTQHSNDCFGDSGGPLFGPNNAGSWDIYGVLSYITVNIVDGQNACAPSKPSYYTRVTYYRDWILANMQQ